MLHDRRAFVRTAALVVLAAATTADMAAGQRPMLLILLRTKGGPRVTRGSSNCSLALVINGVPHVVDCGYGTTRQLLSAGISLESVRFIFVTHHHSDHNLEVGPLMYNAWVTG